MKLCFYLIIDIRDFQDKIKFFENLANRFVATTNFFEFNFCLQNSLQ